MLNSMFKFFCSLISICDRIFFFCMCVTVDLDAKKAKSVVYVSVRPHLHMRVKTGSRPPIRWCNINLCRQSHSPGSTSSSCESRMDISEMRAVMLDGSQRAQLVMCCTSSKMATRMSSCREAVLCSESKAQSGKPAHVVHIAEDGDAHTPGSGKAGLSKHRDRHGSLDIRSSAI